MNEMNRRIRQILTGFAFGFLFVLLLLLLGCSPCPQPDCVAFPYAWPRM